MMNEKPSPGKFMPRLRFIFIIIAVSIILAGFAIYKVLEQKTRDDAHYQLSILARAKIREVTNWRKERTGDSKFILNDDRLNELVTRFLADTSDRARKSRVREFIRTIKENHEYPDIIIRGMNGESFSLFSDKNERLAERDRKYFEEALREKHIVLSDIYFGGSGRLDMIRMASFIPIISGNGQRVFAVLEVKIDPSENLFPAIQMQTKRYKSEETFIIRREGDEVVYLNKLKYADNSRLNIRMPLTATDVPAVMAVLGQRGIVEGKDYRGRMVLADIQEIPGSPWFIISKIDLSEIYAPLRQQAAVIAAFVIILLFLTVLIALYIYKQQQLKLLAQFVDSERMRIKLQERIDYLIKNANDIIVISDDYSRIVRVNDKAVQAYGYSYEEFLGLSIYDIRAEHTRMEIEEQKSKVMQLNGYIFETVHKKKDGTEFPVEVSSRTIEIDGKKYFQSIIRDITERKSYEEKLKNTIRELDRSNKDLEQFAYVAAHDLQEPLRMVHTYAQLIEKKYEDKLNGDGRKYLRYLTEGASRMHQFIMALINYTGITTGTRNYGQVNMLEAVEIVKRNLKERIDESQAVIISRNLPLIKADMQQMVLLIENLVDNAIKYRNEGPPVIHISAVKEGDSWKFSIQDNGIGISREYHEKIFLIFQRLHEREKYPGIGTGLTISRRIVEYHGGRIWVESDGSSGTTIHFTIPA